MPKKAAALTDGETTISVPAPTSVATSEPVDDGDWFAPIDETVDFTNSCFYGREGSGKTTAAARMANVAPDGSRVLFINAEGGLKKGPLRKRGVDTSKIVVWPDPKKNQRVTHKGLMELHRRVKADLMRDPNSWFGIVMDSATEVHTAILDTVQQKRVQKVLDKGAEVDEDFVDIADYGTMSKLFRDSLRAFRDLPCHFVVTALERRDVDKDTGKPFYGPAVTPGLQTDLLGYVDFVLMFKAQDEDGPYRALTKGGGKYRAKDRFDVLPRVLAEPMFDRILGYVDGTLDADTDPFQDDLPVRAPAKAKTTEAENDDADPDPTDV